MTAKNSFVVEHIGELATLAPLHANEKISGIQDSDLGVLRNAWLAVVDGKVQDFGEGSAPSAYAGFSRVDAKNQLVTPGFVDPHTHAIFGGSRASEFARRLKGETYQSIAASGGGIKYTVAQTRQTSDQDLEAFMRKKLATFAKHGVTTVEVKSGYGLSVAEELRILRCIARVAKDSPIHVVATCLALHAKMPEYASVADYVKEICEKLLPTVAKEKLATYVDAFVEKGYFEPADVEPYLAKAKELGLSIRLHADEFADSGAAAAAAKWGAHSADHLECASDAGIAAMAKSKTVAILLPGTSLYAKIQYASAARFRTAGVGVALATDFNPGSCQIDNIHLSSTIGAIHCGLQPAEALAAVTYVAAYSLRMHKTKGSLAKGSDADLCIHGLNSVDEWIADIGRTPLQAVFAAGKPLT